MTNWDLFDHKYEEKEEQGFFRCGFCGRDVEKLFADIFTVSEKNYLKMYELMSESKTFLKIIKTERAVKGFTGQIDDMDTKPIQGTALQVNVEICRGCLDSMGRRHKFIKNQKMASCARQVA